MKSVYWFAFLGIAVVYLFLRLGWRDTIEFGYDQPILSSLVLDFLKNPSFFDIYKYVNVNPWGYPSWGTSQIFFWLPFFLITKHPISLSFLSAIFNLLSIFIVFMIGRRYFSLKVGLLSSFILAIQPWWIVFGRMVYEPTPVLTIVSISMLSSFYLIENPRSKIVLFLVFSWAFLYQLYIHTISFILPGAFVLFSQFRKISKKYFIAGVVFGTILFLPAISYFMEGNQNYLGFLDVSNKFNVLRSENHYSIKDIFLEFIGTLGGGRFNWQLGYGYQDFLNKYPFVSLGEKAGIFMAITVLVYNTLKSFFVKEKRALRILLLCWTLGPLWFLALIQTPIALPRYFLLSLPAFSILLGLMVLEVVSKFGYLFYLFPAVIFLYWFIFIINYYSFIENYSYPRGFLSSFSDVPFSFLDKSFQWVISDAKAKGYKEITISDDSSRPKEFSLNQAQRYYWEYLLGFSQSTNSENIGHYLMYFSPGPKDIGFKQFGPYVVYEVPKN